MYRKLAIKGTGAIIVFAIQILLARMMGARYFGDYAFISTFVSVFTVLSVFGLDLSAESILPQYRSKHQPEFIRGFIKFSNRFIALIAITCCVILFFILLANNKKYSITFNEAFLWGIIALPFISLIHQTEVYRNFLNERKPLFSVRAALYSLTLLFSFYYFYNKERLPVDAVMMIAFICSAIVFFFYRIGVNKRIKPTAEQPQYEIRRWLSTASGFMSMELMQILARNSGVLMLSYFANNISAGFFFVCLRTSSLILASVSISETVSLVEYRHLKKVQHYHKLRRAKNDSMFKILSVAVPAALLLVLFGKPLLRLFGEGFDQHYPALVSICIAQVLLSVSTVNMKIIKAIGNKSTSTGIMIASIALTLLAGAVLIKPLLTFGAGLAVLISAVFYFSLSSYTSSKLIRN